MNPFRPTSLLDGEQGMISVSLALLLTTLAPLAVLQDWYVDVNAPGCATGTGTETDPFCNVMAAVSAAADGDTIHVAPGTYFENVEIDADLELVGTGGAAATILDGSYSGSVVRIGSTATVALRGLTLRHGSGTLTGGDTGGGGLFVEDLGVALDSLPQVTMSDSVVAENTADWGAGIHFVSVSGSSGDGRLDLERTAVRDNVGTQVGGVFTAGSMAAHDSNVSGNTGAICGGVLSQFGSLRLVHSMVVDNTATGAAGGSVGGIYAASGTCDVINSLVARNSASVGGILTLSGSCEVINSTVIFNTSTSGSGGIAGSGSILEGCYSCPEIVNSILWGNTYDQVSWASTEYCLVQGGWPGVGNLDTDPLFAAPLIGDYRLLPGSPCIDAGDDLAVPTSLWTDLDGKLRFLDDPATPDTGRPARSWPVVDMGAYEFGVAPPEKVRRR